MTYLNQIQASHQIIGVVLQWLSHRLSNRLQSCQVDDSVEFVLGKHLFQRRLITNINILEWNWLASDFSDTLQRDGVSVLVCN